MCSRRFPFLPACLLLAPWLVAQAPAPQAQHSQAQHSQAQTLAAQHPPAKVPAHAASARPPVIQPHGPAHPHKVVTPPAKETAAPPAAPAPVAPVPPAAPTVGSVSGLKLPRFAALHTDDVNMRAGPGTRYPIDWVYKRRDLPVEIEREFEVWRLVVDSEGTKGWVHQATLSGRRTFLVTGGRRTLRHTADDQGAPVAYLEPGVIGRILSCAANAEWCQLQVGDNRGYLKRSEFWGTYAGEAVNSG